MKRISLLILVSSLLGVVGVAHATEVGQITEPAWDNPNSPRAPSPHSGDQFLTERIRIPPQSSDSER